MSFRSTVAEIFTPLCCTNFGVNADRAKNNKQLLLYIDNYLRLSNFWPMKSHKETEIDTVIFCSTSGFAPGEITSFFFIKEHMEMKKGKWKI